MKSHVFLSLSAGLGLTQVLAAPYIEKPTRELTGHKTVTTTASAEFHVDGLPGLPKPVFSTFSTHHHHTHHGHGTETGAVTVAVPTTIGGYGGVSSFTLTATAESASKTESETETESIVTEVETETVDIKTVTVAASTAAAVVPKHKTSGEVPSNVARARDLGVEQAGPGPEKQEYTTLTFTFGTLATTYTLALPNGQASGDMDATDTPAPVIRPTRSYPLALPSGTWTEWNTMVTSTVPAVVVHRRSAPTSPSVKTSVSIAPSCSTASASGYHKVLPIPIPIPAPNPNPMEEAALSVTTPAPTLPLPREQVRTTILNGGDGAVERLEVVEHDENFQVGNMKGVQAGANLKQNDAIRNDAPESHDLSWYLTASPYTDDSVSLTMQPCYYDWQCWPEPTSSNTDVFLPGVDGGKVAAATATATQTRAV
ncbi:hypothetical protein QBC32DRAFT_314442 [Pseudoneurospora amorphoporcata]|uniref:Uncharacterized protein n=1 Tax=Pseudoneurospora amorphoporcata TaxID=241081 RepID=A0AAN6NTR6_9PEZI|nr:hypothetical protein QBC32DRAFT_314442 [Pseudoneurospora amorphoporcata]